VAKPTPASGDHEVDAALRDFVVTLRENSERVELALTKAEAALAARATGRSYSEIVESEQRPLVVELVSTNIEALMSSGGRLRRAAARTLHDEGMTMQHIADLFGVSRPRISALLRSTER
jgi:hypothetical protein